MRRDECRIRGVCPDPRKSLLLLLEMRRGAAERTDGETGGKRACIANWFELNKLVSNGLGVTYCKLFEFKLRVMQYKNLGVSGGYVKEEGRKVEEKKRNYIYDNSFVGKFMGIYC